MTKDGVLGERTTHEKPVVFLEGGHRGRWPAFVTSLKLTLFGPEPARSEFPASAPLTLAQRQAVLTRVAGASQAVPFRSKIVTLSPAATQVGESWLAVSGTLRAKPGAEAMLLNHYSSSPMSGLGLNFETIPGRTYLLNLRVQSGDPDSQWQLYGQAEALFPASTQEGGDDRAFGFVANETREFFILFYQEGSGQRIGYVYSATLTQVD